jgi:hypothetical protein
MPAGCYPKLWVTLSFFTFILPLSAPLCAQAPERRVYHMLLATEQEALTAWAEIYAAGSSPKAFRDSARKLSKDAVTKPLGGDLGWIGPSARLDPGFSYAVWTARVGHVSPPVLTEFGWHVVYVEAERGDAPAPQFQKPEPRTEPAGGFGRKSDARAQEIVERYLSAIGGRKALDAIRDRRQEFTNEKLSPTGSTSSRIALSLKSGWRMREEWEIKGFKVKDETLSFTQIYDGAQGWVAMFGTVSPLEGKTLSVFVWEKHLDDFFLHWKEDGYSLKHSGKGAVDGEPAELVEVTDFSGRYTSTYAFSKKDGLLLEREWTPLYETTTSRSGKKTQRYKKYTSVAFADGSGHKLLVPLEAEILVDGELDTRRTYSRVEINKGLADELFNKPEGKPFAGTLNEPK